MGKKPSKLLGYGSESALAGQCDFGAAGAGDSSQGLAGELMNAKERVGRPLSMVDTASRHLSGITLTYSAHMRFSEWRTLLFSESALAQRTVLAKLEGHGNGAEGRVGW